MTNSGFADTVYNLNTGAQPNLSQEEINKRMRELAQQINKEQDFQAGLIGGGIKIVGGFLLLGGAVYMIKKILD